jgi:hypothetical protein
LFQHHVLKPTIGHQKKVNARTWNGPSNWINKYQIASSLLGSLTHCVQDPSRWVPTSSLCVLCSNEMMTWLGWWLSKFVCLATNSLGSLGLKQQLDEMVKVH